MALSVTPRSAGSPWTKSIHGARRCEKRRRGKPRVSREPRLWHLIPVHGVRQAVIRQPPSRPPRAVSGRPLRALLAVLPTVCLMLPIVAVGSWPRPVLAAMPVAATVVPAADGPGGCGGAAPLDVWAVNTRTGGDACARVERFAPGRGWRRADAGALFDGGIGPLVLLVHGNRYEHADALEQAVMLARRLAACGSDRAACGSGPQPPRVVAYSWPSDKQGILLKDSRRKYERARCEAERFSRFLGRIEPERPVGILGYSYGALVTLAGIESLVASERAGAGGATVWASRPAPVHLVLVAAAVRCDAVAPHGPYRAAAEATDRIVLLNNSSDSALRFFPWVDRGLEADALGRVGMPVRWVPPGIDFRQYDAAGAVGSSHRFLLYLEAAGVSRRMCAGLLDGLVPGAATESTVPGLVVEAAGPDEAG